MAKSAEAIYGGWTDAKLLKLFAKSHADFMRKSNAEWEAMQADAPRGRVSAARVRAQRAAEAHELVRLECVRRGLEVAS
jgi:hypothetical protein